MAKKAVEVGPEPVLIVDDKCSDAVFHDELLQNPVANALADEAAVHLAMTMGTPEDLARKMFSAPVDVSGIEEPTPAKKGKA